MRSPAEWVLRLDFSFGMMARVRNHMRGHHYLMPARTADAGKPAPSILAVDFGSPCETKLWRRRFFIGVASHTATQTYPAG
jgi:hypothetical protein